MSKGVAFGADSGTVALALATGEASMPIPESVKVTFKGEMQDHMDFRDVVHATQSQMLKEFGGENVFQGRVIEVHIGTLPSDQAFTFTDWTAEMKAKASICISQDDTLIESLQIARERIQTMIDKGMDNKKKVLQYLFDKSKELAKYIAEELDYIGTMCVEYFIDKNDNLFVNEIAPRVHNSGHLTINAYNVSQFENHIRACLLYTSPSPRDLSTSRMPSSA